MKRLVFMAAVLNTACIGRPIVGEIEEPEGPERMCEVGPECRAIRALDPAHFEVPHVPAPLPGIDCDGDEINDSHDNCLGVPNPLQDRSECRRAIDDCLRLASGDTHLDGADLRGCRLAEPVAVHGPLSLRGALLRCAVFELSADADTEVDLRDVVVRNSRLTITGGGSPIAVDTGRTTFAGSSLTLRGAARLHAEQAVFEHSAIFVEPEGGAVRGAPAPAVDLSRCDLSDSTIWEAAASRPGRIRIDRSSVGGSRFDVNEMSLYGTSISMSRVAAESLDGLEVTIAGSEIRTPRGAFASAELSAVVFDQCTELRFSDSALTAVDVPACPELGVRVFRTELDGCNLEGGVEFDESHYFAGVLGSGPGSVVRSLNTTFDGVRVCDLGAGSFVGGELRCVRCDATAFRSGEQVCLSNVTLLERGCPPIELAPSCDTLTPTTRP